MTDAIRAVEARILQGLDAVPGKSTKKSVRDTWKKGQSAPKGWEYV